MHIVIPPVGKLRTLGDLVTFDKVAFKYKGDAALLLRDVRFSVPQGARVAFVGAVSIWCISGSHRGLDAVTERSRKIYHRESHSPATQADYGECPASSASSNRTLLSAFGGGDHQGGARDEDYSATILHYILWRPWRQGRRRRSNGVSGLPRFARESCFCHACRGTFWRTKGNSYTRLLSSSNANVAQSRSALPSVWSSSDRHHYCTCGE